MIDPAEALEVLTSNEASVLSPSKRDDFWGAVEDCLVKFHGLDSHHAETDWQALRSRIEAIPSKFPDPMIYHAQPFYVACDIAGLHDIPDQVALLKIHRDEYESILDARDW